MGEPPKGKNVTWSSTANEILIDPKKDKNFVREGTYYVAVEPRPNFFEALFGSKQPY
jgi:hypothetical protein